MMPEPSTPLSRALDLADLVVERRNTVPILDNVQLTSDGETLVVEATDLDIQIVIAVPGVAAWQGGTVSAPLRTLRQAINFFGNDATFEPHRSSVHGGLRVGGTFDLPCLDPNEFPRIKAFATDTTFSLDAATFLRDLKAVAHCMSTEETRYYLNGVYLHTSGESLKLAATDGHRLAVVTRPSPVDVQLSAILPKKLVKLLIEALGQGDASQIMFRFGGSNMGGADKVEIEIGDLLIRAKCIDGRFPDYNRVIPVVEEGALLADAAALDRAARAVEVVQSERRSMMIMNLAGDGSIKSGKSEFGEATLPLPGVREGNPPKEIGLTCDYLAAIMAAFEGEVRVSFIGPADPIRFSSASDPSLVAVQMPMRV